MALPAPATAKPIALPRLPVPIRGGGGFRPVRPATASRFRVSASASASDVPDFLSSDWLETHKKPPLGPRLNFNAEEAVEYQLEALKYNDKPRPDYGVEVMYRFAGFDPFERSTYFGQQFDLGQFERFRRIFHHSTYRVLLAHKERKILSRIWVEEPPLSNFQRRPCRLSHFADRTSLSRESGSEEPVRRKNSLWSRELEARGMVTG